MPAKNYIDFSIKSRVLTSLSPHPLEDGDIDATVPMVAPPMRRRRDFRKFIANSIRV